MWLWAVASSLVLWVTSSERKENALVSGPESGTFIDTKQTNTTQKQDWHKKEEQTYVLLHLGAKTGNVGGLGRNLLFECLDFLAVRGKT